MRLRRIYNRGSVGGLWEEMGQRQLEFLVEQGLGPCDDLLDVGCGSLRGGVHFIRYLEQGAIAALISTVGSSKLA